MRPLSRAKQTELRGTALLRADFNSKDDFRMRAVLPTLKFLQKKAALIVILSHSGRPAFVNNADLTEKPADTAMKRDRTPHFDSKFSLKASAYNLEKLLGNKVIFISHFRFDEITKLIRSAPAGSIFLLENLRFLRGEVKNSPVLAKQLAGLGDYYVNDAFAVSHRANASVAAITKFLPSFAGLRMEAEINALNKVMFKPKKPLLVILGGGKAEDKLPVLNFFSSKADTFLLGGVPANTLLTMKGVDVKNSILAPKNTWKNFKPLLKNKKVVLPKDWKMNQGMILDVGPETIKVFLEKIEKAKTIIWNGPLGMFERRGFEIGTQKIAAQILKTRGFALIGGGETLAALKKLSPATLHLSPMIFISTGGGAMLEYLAGNKLPGIEALNNNVGC